MPLRVEEFDNGWKRVMFSACPLCGHIFQRNEHRWKHFLEEHDPEDAGLSPLGERSDDPESRLFEPVEELPGGEET